MAEPEIAPKEASRVLLSIELQRGVEDVYAMAEPLFELFLDNRTRSLFEALHEVTKAVNVFKCINSKNASVEDCLPDAIQRAAAGDPVWSKPPHPPFTADVVRDRLDYYAKQIGLPLRGGKSQ
jgi:hypothetical protein